MVGHVEGVDDTLTHKRVVARGFGGKRPMGKSRGRWEDAVRRDAVDVKAGRRLQKRMWVEGR